ncbi:DUF882 domain-containing protein [Mesorhizobium retamae]|uniref:Murein endopeptidase K n=2 Tax=Pseudomonadota TaxID=1224 RepID=A0ABS9QBC8_9HYPH|nr:DUF882 domain-containing protein [Mesorhizobium sp. IRAMC:0171]MCG7504728.1 DUF882 domain-containing protein [Mesorhizobium sp. IRAMC:0171]
MSVWQKWLTGAVMAAGLLAVSAGTASAEVRALKLRNLHTGEVDEIVFKRNGRYDQSGLKKLNYFLRDWRRNEPTKMDPRLLDLVWEAYRQSGSRGYIQVICGYRAPSTNAMLKSRSRRSGVAEKSQHILGKAMDFYIEGVPLKKLRDIGLKMQGGGVGYYPTSGSPFVHMDVGNVRHWPGISRQELARLFPNGKTLHVPSDGRPLPGYEQAMASYKARKANGTPNIELASAGGSSRKSGGFLAAFFGGGADEEEDTADVAMAPAPKPKAATKPAASAKSNLPGIAIVSPENAQRVEVPAGAEAEQPQMVEEPKQETPETILAALPARSVPVPGAAPRPKADVGVTTPPTAPTPETVPFGMADANAVEQVEQATMVAAAAPVTPENVPFGIADPNAVAPTAEATPAVAEQAVAGNVPVPSWRPKTPAAAEPNQESVLLALAETAKRDGQQTATDALAMLPTQRPDEVKAVLEQSSTDSYQVAALPSPRSAFNDPSGVDAATPRAAVASRPAGSDPAAAMGGNVKTTRKAARANAHDAKPDQKSVVVPAAPKVARWALQGNEQIAKVTDSTTAPRMAYNVVRTAPSEVYTAGFQTGNEMADANRFTGTAVKFMSVARFPTK